MPIINYALLRFVTSTSRPSVSEAEKQKLYGIYNHFLDTKKFVDAQSSISVLENHKLAGITLQYKKEYRKDNVLQSLTAVSKDGTEEGWSECVHLLHLDSGVDIVRRRTTWIPKCVNNYGSLG